MEFNQRVVGGERFEFIGGGGESEASILGDLVCDGLSESDVGIKARPHCCATLGQLRDLRQFFLDSSDSHLELMRIAWKLLAKGERSGVLGVRSTKFDDLCKVLALTF